MGAEEKSLKKRNMFWKLTNTINKSFSSRIQRRQQGPEPRPQQHWRGADYRGRALPALAAAGAAVTGVAAGTAPSGRSRARQAPGQV